MPAKATHLFVVYAGTALEGQVFRIVPQCPPVTRDFLSYEQLGAPYDRRDYFRGLGTSVYTARRRAASAARRYRKGRAIVSLDLRDDRIVWARTGSRGHLNVWAPPEVIEERVVQCEEL